MRFCCHFVFPENQLGQPGSGGFLSFTYGNVGGLERASFQGNEKRDATHCQRQRQSTVAFLDLATDPVWSLLGPRRPAPGEWNWARTPSRPRGILLYSLCNWPFSLSPNSFLIWRSVGC